MHSFLWGPLSEVYGRVKVLKGANLIFLVFNTACGFAQTKQQMMAFRFVSGIGGSAPQAVSTSVHPSAVCQLTCSRSEVAFCTTVGRQTIEEPQLRSTA